MNGFSLAPTAPLGLEMFVGGLMLVVLFMGLFRPKTPTRATGWVTLIGLLALIGITGVVVAVNLGVEDFHPVDPKGATPLKDWSTLTELSLQGHVSVIKDGAKVALPSVDWKKAASIRIRQLRWVGGQYQGATPAAPELSDAERTKAFNDAIKASLEQERRDRDGR